MSTISSLHTEFSSIEALRAALQARQLSALELADSALAAAQASSSLNAFLQDTGHHEASWRHPDSSVERIGDITWYQEMAQKAEAAKLDAVFLADGPAWWGSAHRPSNLFEPITLLTAIATLIAGGPSSRPARWWIASSARSSE